MQTISPEPLAQAFVEVADTLVDDFDLIDFLELVTGHVATLSGTAAVGLLLADHRGHLKFMAASQESARLLELFVIQNNQGPCRDCYATGEPVVVADLNLAHGRWPAFTPRAMAAGFRSVCALPLRHQGTVIGALNMFGTAAEDLSEDDARIIQSLAHVATIGILQQQAIRRGELLTEQLQGALNSRIVIEQAKGALAQLRGTDVDTAYTAMRDYSKRKGLRMGRVALELVTDTQSHPELTMRPAREV
ncbi:GAF and ANTAR domain-containing protein [Ornithinimicrobium sp. W1665]|uniref:GAF and ANTAR domain-containing protein n=1 Tax=Ornithinimicrobium sp. W1665 TaxID=3416666 RepID=UPI003CE848DB